MPASLTRGSVAGWGLIRCALSIGLFAAQCGPISQFFWISRRVLLLPALANARAGRAPGTAGSSRKDWLSIVVFAPVISKSPGRNPGGSKSYAQIARRRRLDVRY